MASRGFGIEIEEKYGDTTVNTDDFALDWFHDQVDDVDFKLNDDIITKSGTSRMDKKARPGVLKPTGSVSSDVDLQRIIWYLFGLLDNYKFSEGTKEGTYIHEFWGGEGKDLHSFRGVAQFDDIVQYLYGIMIDTLKLECSDADMSLSADTIYKTEKSDILEDDAEYEKPADLINDLFIVFYDIQLYLNEKVPGRVNSLSLESKNNLDQDSQIGFGARYPQAKALAGKRENNISLSLILAKDTYEDILSSKYGEVGAREPKKCSLLQVPAEIKIRLCEYPDLEIDIKFPRCTCKSEFNMSGVDAIETDMTLNTLGSEKVTLNDGSTEVVTDFYVKVVNNQPELKAKEVVDSPKY